MQRPDTIYIDEISAASIHSLIHEIEKPRFQAGVLFGNNFSRLKAAFFRAFTLIQAGGGVVRNRKGEILLILRRNMWDLPKGKLDEGETIEQCALREVGEETGLKNIEIVKPIGITYHTYKQYRENILKESHWYEMTAAGDDDLIPQVEEDITEIKWVDKASLPSYTQDTFPAIARLLEDYSRSS